MGAAVHVAGRSEQELFYAENLSLEEYLNRHHETLNFTIVWKLKVSKYVLRLDRPSPKCAPHQQKLPQMIRSVVGRKQHLAQQGLPITPRKRFT
jgi:hypothetical protein